jgi:2-polyprenyl-6-methoxyphenol hydroxylase-like FAD-dependent oxidoreductase
VRNRVKAIGNIEFLEAHDVLGLVATTERDRVTGARVVDRVTDRKSTLTGEVVVDATGRGSRTPVFLEELGYGRPPEDEVVVQLSYACQLLRMPPDALRELMTVVFPEPGRRKMFGLIKYENNTWMLGVGGVAGLEPPGRTAEMLDFAADFVPARVIDTLRSAEPLGEVVRHRVPSNRWRRYDKMRRTPEGLVVVGDAVCSFNPIYGQGMTTSAIEATILRDCLRHGTRGLARRFLRASAKQVRVPWQTAVGSDLNLPEVEGPRPLSMRITNAYLEKVMTAAESDPIVVSQFMRVTSMIDPPTRLMRPAMVLRVLRSARSRTDAHSPDQVLTTA